ncbi:PLP-dependent aminotransferase family protein [Bordetella sp. 15P40C-2]|uniref:MocR-like pyridoxine biosynthesis transcription factor PdxR n=1 Tax=Bordetella sp. 15P40C-2 TaxID=2572246 RepID=UPI001F2CF897|nr:PLP-dependent aminotransferase family protein [Bordetella sp. 15P40C-2]
MHPKLQLVLTNQCFLFGVLRGIKMRSWSLDWLLQRNNWEEELAEKSRQRMLGAHLVHLFRQAISSNILQPGERLPSVRDLMTEIGISRNTAAYVYEQLYAEGYVVSRVGSGTYVALLTPAMVHRAPLPEPRNADVGSTQVKLSRQAQSILDQSPSRTKQWGAFQPGVPDVRAFPRAVYARIINRLWRHAQPEMLTYGTAGGVHALKSALANYLRVGRGVQCRPEQILITDGTHQAMDLTIRALTEPKDAVWTEEPGYWGTLDLLKINPDISVVRREVDEEGITLSSRAASPKLIFVTPSHQYPLGVVMSLDRRKALLEYARAHHSWIVEDDYDSEYRFGGRHVPAIQGLEKNAPVIYVGTFSKTLFPGLRVAYMVLPEPLVDPFTRLHAQLYHPGNLVTQMALAEFIGGGHYTKHIRKMRVVYGNRRQWLRKLILRHLGPQFLAEKDSYAGLHINLYLPQHIDDVEITSQLQQRGVLTRPLSSYYQNEPKTKGLLLGYAAVEEHEMQKAFFDMLPTLRAAGVSLSLATSRTDGGGREPGLSVKH